MAFTGNYTCNSFKQQLFEGDFDFSSSTTQTFKIALYTNDVTLDQTTTAYTTTGEVVATGYTAGGELITPSLAIDSSNGITYVDFTNASWTGAFTARGALIYRDDSVVKHAICVLDFGSDKTSTTTFVVEFPPNTSTGALIRLA
jgi:hypothetical protein